MIELRDNELEAMRVLWEESPLKPADVQKRFGWSIDNGTLRSALVNLVEKGHARREKRGKAYFYWAVTKRPRLLRELSRRMSQVFAEGSTAGLIMELLRTERLTPKQLEELQRIAGERQRKK
ncbi:BlaI/MecI/CopY family transcriptional regulator [bacterium]|nr:BlaI/MecI/CopY family transcriptional regulator [bacterium]